MTKFSIGSLEVGQAEKATFSDFVSIAKGRSIVSAADWGEGRLELGLSGGAMLRVFWPETSDVKVNLVQTLNADEIPPILISLGDMPQRVPLATVVRKLQGLRTLYAIFFLYHTDRTEELFEFLELSPDGDIEKALISPDDALHVESISYGSWVLALWAKTKSSYKAISSIAGLAFDRGREAFLQKMEADARLANAKAKREEILAEKNEFELRKSQLGYMLEVSERASSPELRAQIERRMIAATRDLTAGDPEDAASYKQLDGPSSSGPRS